MNMGYFKPPVGYYLIQFTEELFHYKTTTSNIYILFLGQPLDTFKIIYDPIVGYEPHFEMQHDHAGNC